jgi:aminoglycoside phosphotransferase (APT) family kinase protein
LCLNVLDKLIELHQVPYQGTELEKLGKGEGYCRRQVEGWDARYSKALTPNVPDFALCVSGCCNISQPMLKLA